MTGKIHFSADDAVILMDDVKRAVVKILSNTKAYQTGSWLNFRPAT